MQQCARVSRHWPWCHRLRRDRVNDDMFVAAARALSEWSPARRWAGDALYPPLEQVRDVARDVALAVGMEAQRAGLADQTGREELSTRIRRADVGAPIRSIQTHRPTLISRAGTNQRAREGSPDPVETTGFPLWRVYVIASEVAGRCKVFVQGAERSSHSVTVCGCPDMASHQTMTANTMMASTTHSHTEVRFLWTISMSAI